MSKKVLYSFSIDRETEVEKAEVSKDSEGNEIKITRKIKEKVPVKLVIYKPSKRQMDDANFEYGKQLNKMMNAGFLTRVMLTKKYADTGGALSQDEAKYLNKLRFELQHIQDQSIRIGALKESDPVLQKEWEDLREQDVAIRQQVLDLESAFRTLFEHTADSKAETYTILWFALFLTYIQEKEQLDPRPYFDGDDFESKLEDYYEKEEVNDPFYTAVREKLFLVLSFWWHAGASDPKDFELLEAELKKEVKSEDKE